MSERLAERRQQQLDQLDDATRQQLHEHVSGLQQQLSDVRRTTDSAIRDETRKLSTTLAEALRQVERQQAQRIAGWETALSDAETRQRARLERIEEDLGAAATQAERLSRVGGIRSWTRPLAITAAVMLAVGGVAASGLLLTDRLIESRLERLSVVNEEIQQAESLPRLPEGVELREIEGATYLQGVDPRAARTARLENGTLVIQLTHTGD